MQGPADGKRHSGAPPSMAPIGQGIASGPGGRLNHLGRGQATFVTVPCLNLYRRVVDAESVFQLLGAMMKEAVVGRHIWTDEMSSQCGLGRAHAPDMEILARAQRPARIANIFPRHRDRCRGERHQGIEGRSREEATKSQ